MKYCKNCSAVLGDLDVFCPECGASVDLDDSAQNVNNTVNAQNNQNGTQNEFNGGYQQEYNGGYQQPQQPQQPPQQNYNNQQYNSYNQQPAKNPGQLWLILSIVSLLCCGGLLAIPSLIFAILSNQSFNRGDMLDAQNKANTSKILFFVAIGLGILFSAFYIIAIVTGMADIDSLY